MESLWRFYRRALVLAQVAEIDRCLRAPDRYDWIHSS